MSRKWKRIYGLGVLSYALTSITLFAIVCGLFPDGTEYLPSYLLVGLALAAISYWLPQKWQFPGTLIAMAVGVGSMFLIDFEQIWALLYPAAILLLIAFLQARRNNGLLSELQYARRLLMETYSNDVKIIVALGLLAAFINVDPSWQVKVLPFFTAFIVTRMMALSLATKATKEREGEEGFKAMVQNRLPFVVLGVALFVCWVLMSAGGAIGRMLLTLLDPLVNGIGQGLKWLIESDFIPQWLKDFLAMILDWINEFFCWMGLCSGGDATPAKLEPLEAMPDLEPGNWMRILIMFAIFVVVALALFFYYKWQNPSRKLPSDGSVEVREFIRNAAKPIKQRPRLASGTLTRMRKTYRKFLLAMQKRGLGRGEGETASELTARIAAASPGRRAELEELTNYYMQERYGGKRVDEQVKRAEQLTKDLTE